MSERDAGGAFDMASLDPGGLDPQALGAGALAPAQRHSSSSGSRGRARLIAGLLLVVVAATGVVGGVALDRWMFSQGYWRPTRMFGAGRRTPRSQGEEQQRIAGFLTRELALTPAQRVHVDSVVAVQVRDVHGVWTSVRPRMDSVINRARVQIEAVLTPEQQAKFKEIRERRERRMREGGIASPPPSPIP